MNIIQYENYQEKREPDESAFPYLTYLCSIPLDFKQVPLHWHDEMEFVYVKKGSALISVDFTTWQAAAGDIVLICPGQLHSIHQDGSRTVEYENMIFPLSLLDSRQPDLCWEQYFLPINRRQVFLPALIRPGMDYYTCIASCLDQIDEIRKTFPNAYELLIKGKLYELFFHLYSHGLISSSAAVSSDESPKEDKPHVRPKSLDKTRQVLKYVEQHYSSRITIKEMAEASGFSQSHFMKFFKATIGVPFTAYLNDYRLTMAARLLLSSEDSVLSIAGETGFDNLSYFNRVFRQKFGMTPREFRRQGTAALQTEP